MIVSALVLQGVLITYQGGVPIGRETFRDDGKVLRSEIELAGRRGVVQLQRAPRKVTVMQGAGAKESEVPAGTIVLPNGSWQAYAIAAEWIAPGEQPIKVKVLIPEQGKTVDGTLQVKRGAGGARTIEAEVSGVHAVVELSAKGQVKRAQVAKQLVEARPDGEPPPLPPGQVERKPPAGVTEEPLRVARPDVVLQGVLWRPRAAKTKAIALILAGSGPTDRDGNSMLGIKTDMYRQLAEALARRGIASARYDKRGVGASVGTFEVARLTLSDFADDAVAAVAELRRRVPGAEVVLVGHSEGGLLSILAAGQAPVDRLVLLETGGRPLGTILREQIGRQAPPAQMAELDRVLAALAAGHPPDPIQPPLDQLFPPPLRAFLASEVTLDPVPALKKLKAPTVIVQGESDAQVTVEDAKLLAAARPDAKLVIVPRMNHVLKEEAKAALPQASYTDPSKPLVPALIDAVAAGVAGKRSK
jgi:alpha-beta hydrolase superfamily lysophospholipase